MPAVSGTATAMTAQPMTGRHAVNPANSTANGPATMMAVTGGLLRLG
jgi:hypothetical protein